MATLLEIATAVAGRTNKNITDATTKARLYRHINAAAQQQWDGFEWSFRSRDYSLALLPDVTSGTMTATNGSQTITASGTPFNTSAHVGAWIRFTGDNPQNLYKVIAVASTSSATIVPAYQGTTASGKTYELKKTDYLFPSELLDIVKDGVKLGPYSTPLDVSYSANYSVLPPNVRGVPSNAVLFEPDFTGSTYTTGTVTISINTNTLVGVGTSWLANVTPGDSITIGSTDTNVYTVYSVNSDTSITLYQKVTLAASTLTYSIARQFGRYIRFTPSPDMAYNVIIVGLRKYARLINDNDVNMFTYRYASQLEEDAIRRELGASPDPRETNTFQIADSFWASAKAEDQSLTSRSQTGSVYNMRG